MSSYASDEELNMNNSHSQSVAIEEVTSSHTASLNSTPTNNSIHPNLNSNRSSPHKHNQRCFHYVVITKTMEFINKSKCKASPHLPNNDVNASEPKEKKRKKCSLNVGSIDDGFLEETHSPLRSSDCSDLRVPSSSAGSSYSESNNDICHEGLCSHLQHVLQRYQTRPGVIGCPEPPLFEETFLAALENLIGCFVDKWEQDSSGWLRNSVITINSLDIVDARRELRSILNSMFEDRLTWGRIVAMLGFVGELSLAALAEGRNDLVTEYLCVSVDYVDSALWGWILNNGGWRGIVEFQKGQRQPMSEFESVFNGLSRVAVVAGFALAGIALCKYVVDRI